jgi:hypothetical protein
LTEPKEARALQLAGGDWKLFVYFEALISSVSYANRSFLDARDIAAGGRRADAGDMITRAYTAVDTRVHDLVAQAGDGLCLALVFEFADYPSTSAASRKEPLPALGRLVVSCGAGRHVAAMTRPDDVAATLRYLAGLSGPNGQGTPLLEVRTRCWTPTRPPLAPAGDGGTLMPATADTLRGLGSVEYASSPS